MSRIALFDLDRTLLRKDTVSLYVRYTRGLGELRWRDRVHIAWWIAQYSLGVLDAPGIAEQALSSLRGMPEIAFAARCDDWVRRDVERYISDEARVTIRRHRAQGDLLGIVTGATPYVARPIARKLGIEHVIATELEILDQTLTGRPHYPLCYGEGKILRTRALADELGFDLADAWFYSDSITDLPLLSAVGHPVVVNPDWPLRREALRRRWPIESW